MNATEQAMEVQTFEFRREAEIAAPVDVTFEAVLAEMGPEMQMPDGKPFPLKLEAWPGGRWFRDLGDGAGHLWGHVQVVKRPALIELCGPMFVSYPVANHIQYRLVSEGDGSTRIRFCHRAFGWMPKGFMDGADQGWDHGVKRIREIAARMLAGRAAAR